MSITLTQSAASHIKTRLAAQGHGCGLRISIKQSGCSGYAYEVDYAETISPETDTVIEAFGAKAIIANKYIPLMDGTEIDYQAKGLNWAFVFNNPKAQDECGCGESFSLVDDSADKLI